MGTRRMSHFRVILRDKSWSSAPRCLSRRPSAAKFSFGGVLSSGRTHIQVRFLQPPRRLAGPRTSHPMTLRQQDPIGNAVEKAKDENQHPNQKQISLLQCETIRPESQIILLAGGFHSSHMISTPHIDTTSTIPSRISQYVRGGTTQ